MTELDAEGKKIVFSNDLIRDEALAFIERSKSLAIPYALIRAKPPAGQPMERAAGRFKLTRNGGVNNAFTWLDYTAYYETLPSDRLDIAIQIESDRMVNAKFDPDEVESERTVIISERQGHENELLHRLPGSAGLVRLRRSHLRPDGKPVRARRQLLQRSRPPTAHLPTGGKPDDPISGARDWGSVCSAIIS